MEYTTTQAARTYDANPILLLRLIAMGRLEARRNERGFWLISKSSLDAWSSKRIRRTPRTQQPEIAHA